MSDDGPDLRVAAGALGAFGPLDVHALYKLRVDVFVAEQDCPYAEIDEVDADPRTTHLLAWAADVGPGGERREQLVSTLRVFGSGDRGDLMHLGRVCTAAGWRGRGIAARLIREGLDLCGDRPVEIGAQTHLETWYQGFGFTRCGEDYLDGRIPHLPMRREAP